MSSKQSQPGVMPISLLLTFLQQQKPVQIWLFEQTDSRIEGKIRGFDEFMNIVIDGAVQVNTKKETRRQLGQILLKGDNITMVSTLD